MVSLGITGSIGAGKSTAAAWFARRGAVVADADRIAKDILLERADIQHRLRTHFGQSILDERGQLDFAALARVAFADTDSQLVLNGLVHPPVLERLQEQLELAAARGERLFIVDAPLIFETGLDDSLDAVIVVVAPWETRFARVNQRSGMSRLDFQQRDALQLSQEEKKARADYVVENSGDMAQLELDLSKVLQDLQRRFPELRALG